MIFNLERPIADQLVESILDHSEEWEIVLVSGNPTKHVHKNGVEIWVFKNQPYSVELWKPDTIKLIELTDEDKRRIYKAVIQIREETDAQRLLDAKNSLIQLMNKGKTPPRNGNVVQARLALAALDPIIDVALTCVPTFKKVASWAGTGVLIIIFLVLLTCYLGNCGPT